MKTAPLILLCLIVVLSACKTKVKESMEDPVEGFVIKRGVNVSHWLSQTEIRGEERSLYVGAEDFAKIAQLGFDHVRIPFDEEHMWDEEGNKNKEAFELLHNAIQWAFDNDLRVIVDLHVLRSHHFNAESQRLWTDTTAQNQFWGFWKQMSEELIQYPVEKLAYELMNEAVADDPDDWNRLISKGIETVRVHEPERVIVVGSNMWQQVHTFKDLKIPEGDRNLILSFHFYDPFIMTHYKAPWTGTLQKYTGEVHYPGYTVDTLIYQELPDDLVTRLKESNGYWDAERIEEAFMQARVVADRYGLPLYCGEFGCYPTTSSEMRYSYYKDIVSVFNKLDISWTHWNYKNDFPVVDEKTLEPLEKVVSGLME